MKCGPFHWFPLHRERCFHCNALNITKLEILAQEIIIELRLERTGWLSFADTAAGALSFPPEEAGKLTLVK